jgi:pimeloyl-ACP methyl ester carboxylesterase
MLRRDSAEPPSLPTPERIWIERDGQALSVLRWQAPLRPQPAALLTHGTGFIAELWQDIAERLLPVYTVYALDRRGHGASHKPPAGQYHFADFAEDVVHVMDTLALDSIYGIGHSAGATDLLLAAALRPGRFRRIFAMEPTAMPPLAAGFVPPALSETYQAALQATLRRRAQLSDRQAAYERLRSRPAFAEWTEAALRRYVEHGFELLPDGRVQLHCLPETEVAMLDPIYRVMDRVYTGDARGQPFERLREIACPVRITTSQKSAPIYKQMAGATAALIPGATTHHFEGVGHCVAQEAPELAAAAILAFDSPR